MLIGGLQKFSLLDYPNCLSAIVFTQGCNFLCQFCYNPMLVLSRDELQNKEMQKVSLINELDLFDFLKTRINKLDAVVISGGEPTLHSDLPEFIKKIKNLGFRIKLDTNGTNPVMLENLYKQDLLDYVAMDLKTSFKNYDLVVGTKTDLEKIKKSIELIMNSNIDYEFRTTVAPSLVTVNDIKEIAEVLAGAKKWYLQKFKNEMELINNDLKNAKTYSDKAMEEMKKIGQARVAICEVR